MFRPRAIAPAALLFALALNSPVISAADKLPPVFEAYVVRVSETQIDTADVHVHVTPDLVVEDRGSGKKPYSKVTLRPGDHIHVDGKPTSATDITALHLKIEAPPKELWESSDFMLSDNWTMPVLRQDGEGWQGQMYLNGMQVQVNKFTGMYNAKKEPFDPSLITPQTRVTSRLKRMPDGTITATSLLFAPMPVSPDEVKFRGDAKPLRSEHFYTVMLPNALSSRNQKVDVKELADEETQAYVRRVGQSVVPPWMKALPKDDPARIDFTFPVVDGETNFARTLNYGNGTIIVPLQMLMNLDNEAQLAALLAHEVAMETGRKLYQHRIGLGLANGSQWTGLILLGWGWGAGASAARKSILKEVKNDAAREAIPYLIGAGYDPRQAAEAWVWADGSPGIGLGSDRPLANDVDGRANQVNAALATYTSSFEGLRIGREEMAAMQRHVETLSPALTRLHVRK